MNKKYVYKLFKMKYRTLEVSKRLKEFDGNLEEFDCRHINCLDCPFHINNSNSYCVDFNETELKILCKLYLRLPLKH